MLKKRPLNIFGRKNQNLYDTNISIKDMGLPGESDNTELVLGSAAIPESGTASVRARPTVKHHASSSDSFQGFNVPTPKVPLLPPVNGPKVNGSVGGGQLSNGSVLSMSEIDEDDIFVPPHPSVAPPPPPGAFIIPPPDFMGDLSTLQTPSLPFSSPPEDDLAALKPPPMSPPKPPTANGPASPGPIASPTSGKVPDRPKFAPPQPPTLQYKTPPPKPVRLSSISILDSPPETPAPPPPVQTPTLSTFNPQNKAKLYDVPKTSNLGGYAEPSTKPKQMILLEDSSPAKPVPVLAQVDGKVPQVPPPSKPVSKDILELKENLEIPKPSPAPPPEPKETKTVSVQPIVKPPRITQQPSPQLPKVNSPVVDLDSSKDKIEGSLSHSRRFSPIIDRKLRNLKSSETNTTAHAASPLALLMAAKERDKHRTTHSLSRENSDRKDEEPGAIIQQSRSSPNSFIVTPRSSSSSSLTSQETLQESPRSYSPVKNTQTIQTPQISGSSALAKLQPSSPSLALSKVATSPSPTNLVVQKPKPKPEPAPLQVASIQNGANKEELNVPFLPPPPEFDDFDGVMGPPPSMPPPDPPVKKAPTPILNLVPKAPVPSPPTKPKPPAAPKLPPPDLGVKPKLKVQENPKMVSNQLPTNLSPSQATLLSILQKKMLEMDHKMAPANETESGSDDWGSPLSDEDNKVPVIPKAPSPQSKSYPVVKSPVVKSPVVKSPLANKAVDMQELEDKMAKKHQDSPSMKVPNSNGQQSKHQYGMTFTVRPGTKQPITLVRKGEP